VFRNFIEKGTHFEPQAGKVSLRTFLMRH
jgi:hypothetical protein